MFKGSSRSRRPKSGLCFLQGRYHLVSKSIIWYQKASSGGSTVLALLYSAYADALRYLVATKSHEIVVRRLRGF